MLKVKGKDKKKKDKFNSIDMLLYMAHVIQRIALESPRQSLKCHIEIEKLI